MDIISRNALPPHWDLRAIGEFVFHHRGGAPLRPGDFTLDGIMVLPKKAIGPGGKLRIPTGSETFCSAQFAEKNKRSIATSDYLITTLRDLVPSGPAIGYVVQNRFQRDLMLAQGVYAFIVDATRLDENYLIHISNTANYRRTMKRIMVGSTQVHIRTGEYFETRIPIPPIEEQKRIAEILGTWDDAIELTERLIEALKKRKKGLMQRLLFGVTRFPKFIRSYDSTEGRYFNVPQDWDYAPISEVASQSTAKNVSDYSLPVLSCTKYDGLVDSLEYFGRRIYSDDTATYRIVERGQFAYATNHIEEGSIGYQDLHDRALISPMYTVFSANDHVNNEYLYRLLKTETYRRIFEINTNSSVNRRGSLRWNDFSKIRIPLPGLEEQTFIAQSLILCERQVAQYQECLRLLMEQKKGLMQRLLTGQVRVKVD